MRNSSSPAVPALLLGLSLLAIPGTVFAQGHPSRGLWVGEIVLNKVNEAVVGINSANQVVAQDPNTTTPTSDNASIRLLVHVDAAGQVRLLKHVVAFDRATNGAASDIALVTDDTRYGDYPPRAKRLTSAAFDFGESLAVDALNQLATAVGQAAGTNASGQAAAASAAAARAIGAATTNAPAGASAGYTAFVASPAFTTNGSVAAAAAAAAAIAERAIPGRVESNFVNAARSAALKALNVSRAFAAADAVPLNEAKLSGDLSPGGVVSGQIFLGANHPTNPFRHRRHPDHTAGLNITRNLTLLLGTNGATRVGFGVDRLSGVYREEVHGLHKPLGPQQDTGLKTEGSFTLNRISLVSTLNP